MESRTVSVICWIYGIIFAVIVLQYVYRVFKWSIFFKLAKWGPKPSDKLTGKVVVVTGASRGLGRVLAGRLYLQGANIIALCRNKHRGERAVGKIISRANLESYHGTYAYFIHLDLASFDSIRTCVEKIKRITTKIDILINNAGLFNRNSKSKTKEGFTLNFGANFLGHFLLTEMLIPLMVASKSEEMFSSKFKPKIINVACSSHGSYPLDLDKLGCQDTNVEVEPWRSYCNSKLAMILHAKCLARQQQGVINTYSVNPGDMGTRLSYRIYPRCRPLLMELFWPMHFKNRYYAVESVLYCILNSDAHEQTGLYYENRKVKSPHSRAKDYLIQDAFYAWSRRAVGLSD